MMAIMNRCEKELKKNLHLIDSLNKKRFLSFIFRIYKYNNNNN